MRLLLQACHPSLRPLSTKATPRSPPGHLPQLLPEYEKVSSVVDGPRHHPLSPITELVKAVVDVSNQLPAHGELRLDVGREEVLMGREAGTVVTRQDNRPGDERRERKQLRPPSRWPSPDPRPRSPSSQPRNPPQTSPLVQKENRSQHRVPTAKNSPQAQHDERAS